MNKSVRETKDSDLFYLSDKLREADKEEIRVVTNKTNYFDALFESYIHSDYCNVILGKNDLPIFIFGVNNDGLIWALGTDDIKSEKKHFIKVAKKEFNKIIKKYRKLYNFIYKKNKDHIEFIEYLGFKVEKNKDEYEDFYYFHIVNDDNGSELCGN